MKNIFILIFFNITLQSIAQQPEYFNFTDTTFKINTIKRIPVIFPDCQNHIDADDRNNIDSIVNFLQTHKSIVLELGVHYYTAKYDRGQANHFKSLLVEHGADASRITTAGYGCKYPIYSKKTMKELRKKFRIGLKNGEESKEFYEMYERFDQMNNENRRIELKILQQ